MEDPAIAAFGASSIAANRVGPIVPHIDTLAHQDTSQQTIQSPPLLVMSSGGDRFGANEVAHQQIARVCGGSDKRRIEAPPPRILPSVGAFTVQCARCMKWRLIPTKEKYEKIRHSILEAPFFCRDAVAWRPEATCEEPSDLSQDMNQLWAIDRPNIPLAPPGWERLLVIRGAGASKFADVYYRAPSGRKLRSMPEVERYLAEHPEYVALGVSLRQFSFVIPRPLYEGYVRKRTVDTFTAMRGSVTYKKPRVNNVKSKVPALSSPSSKDKSLARTKSLARILASDQAQGLQLGGSKQLGAVGEKNQETIGSTIQQAQDFVVSKEPTAGIVQKSVRLLKDQAGGNLPQQSTDSQELKENLTVATVVLVNNCTDLIEFSPNFIRHSSSTGPAGVNKCTDLIPLPTMSNSYADAFKENASSGSEVSGCGVL